MTQIRKVDGRRRLLLTVAWGLGLTGCTSPHTARPEAPLAAPDAWAAELTARTRADISRWWQHFGEPELDALITATLTGNLDLAAARARVRTLRAQAEVTGSAARPALGVTGQGGRLRDDVFTGLFGIPDQSRTIYQTGFDASWEIDLFGGVAARTRAARAEADAAALGVEDLAISLTAETARQWLELRGQRERHRILLARIATERERATLLADRVRAGLSTDAELAVVQADLATLEAAIPPLAEVIDRTGYRLAVLGGQSPARVQLGEQAQRLPEAPVVPDPGLPAELLARRPDVRAAVLRLDATGARIDAARADRLPRFMLTGLIGARGDEGRTFSVGPGLIYQLLPQIRLPLLAGGGLKAQVEAREAEQEFARQRWGQVMLDALEDVEGALTGLTRERERLSAQRQALERARLAETLATARERGGLEDYFPVLDARRRTWELEEAEVQSNVRLLTQTVALYKALGGGWREEGETEPGIKGTGERSDNGVAIGPSR
ncbi:MAG TPA: hypothetical protein DCY89_05815 [Gammaproteobacteria bacterium]|nr:hypothetical protein [Gammaproteobacteria bacterium]